jgi:hypothetical protein
VRAPRQFPNPPKPSKRFAPREPFFGFRAQRPWTPRDLPFLEVWLDANQCASSANGDSVGLWPDLSGHAYDAKTFGTQPVFATNQVNGKPALTFGGAAKLQIAHNANFPATGDLDIFILGRINSVVGTGVFIAKDTGGAGVPTAFLIGYATGSALIHYADGVNDIASSSQAALNAFALLNVVRSAGVIEHNFNSTSDGSSAFNPTGPAATSNPILLGCDNSGVNFLVGKIAEIVICSQKLNLTDRTRMRNYVRNKYGLY